MFTIDLKEKLIAEKNSTIRKHNEDVENAEKFLQSIKMTLADLDAQNLKLIENVGFNLEQIKNIKNLVKEGKKDLEKDATIFSIEEIKSLCLKYRLRFLNTIHYKGFLPIDISNDIKKLEKEEGRINSDDCFILAPKSSFLLKEKPKPVDPLFFYKVSKNKYKLIRKWGNDLSIFRRILGFFTDYMYKSFVIIPLIIYLNYYIWTLDNSNDVKGIFIFFGAVFSLFAFGIIGYFDDQSSERIWNSEFK